MAAAAIVLMLPASAAAVDRHATTSTFASTFAAAQGGDTVYLAAGSYGTWQGGAKTSPGVTIMPEPGATASMALNFKNDNSAKPAWLTLDGLTITNASVAYPTHDVTIRNSTFTGSIYFYSGGSGANSFCSSCSEMKNANILLDHNTHNDIDPGGLEGRIDFAGSGPDRSQPVGVTIQNSTFSGGLADGIQNGGVGVRIIGNTFRNITDCGCGPHTDSIQLYGSKGTVIQGNYFTGNTDNIVGFDGNDHEVITDNVMTNTVGQPWGIVLGGDNGSIIQHNTMKGLELNLTSKSGQTSRNETITDNIASAVVLNNGVGGNAQPTVNNYNLCSSSPCAGANSMQGSPTFTGGANPSSYSGFTLANGSAGKGNASDGMDRGIRAAGAPPADTTPPETTITSAPADPSTSTSASIAFNSSESGSAFECKLDAGAFGNCTSPKGYSGLSAGSHTFSVRATDAAGNTDASPAVWTWTISPPADTTAPDTTITAGPTDPSTSTSASFSFSANEAGSVFECKLDTAAFGNCTSPRQYTGLSTGPHTFTVRATDGAGNTDASPAVWAWTIGPPSDTTAPQTTISSGPANPTTATTASFSFTSDESGSTFECKLDAAAFAPCTSPKAYSGLGTGPHTFSVRATDAAGNTDASPATQTWTINPPPDTTPPDTAITSGPSGPTNDATPSFAFSSEAGATFTCRVDAGSYAACTSPWTTATLSDGGHSVSVRAKDAAGNTDPTPATRSFTVDTVAPRTTITSSPPALSLSGSGSVAFTVNETGASSQCRLDGGAWAACTSPYEVSGLGVGSHTVDVRSTDAAGNLESPGASATWTVLAPVTAAAPAVAAPAAAATPAAAPGPSVTLTAPTADATIGSTARFAADASSSSAVTRVEFWVDSKRVASDAKAPYAAKVDLSSVPDGTHTVVARAFDVQGQAASTAQLVRVSRTAGRVRAAAVRSAGRLATLNTAAAGPGSTRLAGQAPKQRMLEATLARCGDRKGKVVDRARMRADGLGHLAATRERAGLCVLALALAS